VVIRELKEIARLEPGTEIVRGTVQGTVEVRPGDDWLRLLSAEIVLEDGRVVEIREG
jgi:2-keto-4-pentenoate hydratase/2-oxohepta-3-ene-1,7-dioic acid hydratase in catechol pathway